MVHLVWATKSREPIIKKEFKNEILTHIKENSIKQNIFIDTMNCVTDHIHLLISLGNNQTISNVVQLIKGESSHWINSERKFTDHFEWQKDYFAVSVSESLTGTVRKYINNQEEHHRKKSFLEECDEIIKKYKFIMTN
jgi:REP element-mobilizing transposase RayT